MSETSTNEWPVDSTSYTLPDGREVIGRDAYDAEMVKVAFASLLDVLYDARAAAAVARPKTHGIATEDYFTSYFIGSLHARLSLTPEGRKAWMDSVNDATAAL